MRAGGHRLLWLVLTPGGDEGVEMREMRGEYYQQHCDYHHQSQQEQLYQVITSYHQHNTASNAGNQEIFHLYGNWKQFVLSQSNNLSSSPTISVDRPSPYKMQTDSTLNSARYIKPPVMPNTSIKTIILENSKNQQNKKFCQTWQIINWRLLHLSEGNFSLSQPSA